mmetsp:Transcript_12314/g.16911  ORF Transcript_12314/g.16911 Transcript_12314/m.16911 type:complete len:213 (+) Transcript_12314:86-724(+)
MNGQRLKLYKVLYIDREMDEKPSARLLEESMSSLIGVHFAFTVVSNPFIGLECTEHTEFDAIFISSFKYADINGWDFGKILRNIGSEVPIILVEQHDEESSFPSSVDQSKTFGFHFFSVLQKPYTHEVLADSLRAAIKASKPCNISSYNNTPGLDAVSTALLSLQKHERSPSSFGIQTNDLFPTSLELPLSSPSNLHNDCQSPYMRTFSWRP